MDQEKETKRQAERCRALAQRIVRELTPASIQVLGGSGALAEALEKAGAQLLPENAEQGTAALLVVEDPEWVDLPALQCAQVLLVCTDASAMADCAKQLAAQGLYRDFEWKNRGKAQQTALFCRSAAVQDAQQLLAGYEMTLDDLRYLIIHNKLISYAFNSLNYLTTLLTCIRYKQKMCHLLHNSSVYLLNTGLAIYNNIVKLV